ncbi:hypothetical protein EJ377_15070 [Chryseobacterium arthrosphaerae]|uniref:Uncharacterized protein n=1 Tax=Chryseobacterium arthrosphaerae TaxID=651561 RepID=A0A432DS67_9FLAO|nr:hypothetical protein EJ377_15070 [Chryseobacterium arthrosphaerae]
MVPDCMQKHLARNGRLLFLTWWSGGDYRYLLPCKDLADKGYRVVFYDQRGSGLSQRFPKKSYTSLGAGAADLMYDELHAVIAHYRKNPEQKVVLLDIPGRDAGFRICREISNDIQGLIVCEPGGLVWMM